jgi:predicted MFS family arabinose efflux permease
VGATTLMTRPWQLVLLWGVVVGGGTGMGALVLGAVVVNRWFHERRGVVMGILTASTATGQLVFLPALAWLAEHRGWRASVGVVAGASAVVIPLVLLLMRERPRDLGLRPYGAAGDVDAAPQPAAALPLAGLARGVRSRDFWLLALTFFICGASTNGLVGTHFIPAAHDHGIPQVTAAGLLAVMGICDLLGTTLSGWLSDRWDSRRLLAGYYGLRGLSLVFLPYAFAGPHASLAVFALFYGLDWVATVPPTVRLTADAFGKENVGVMFGWIVAGHQLGAAFATGGAGAVRTWRGDYHAAFVASGLLCMIASVLALNVGRRVTISAPAGVPVEARRSPSTPEPTMQSPDTATAGPESLALEFLGRVWGPAHDLDAIDELMTENYVITTGGKRSKAATRSRRGCGSSRPSWAMRGRTAWRRSPAPRETASSRAGCAAASTGGCWACRRTAAASPSPASPSGACEMGAWPSAGWSAARGSCTRSSPRSERRRKGCIVGDAARSPDVHAANPRAWCR